MSDLKPEFSFEVFEKKDDNGVWVAKITDGKGDVSEFVFSGSDARKEAETYARHRLSTY